VKVGDEEKMSKLRDVEAELVAMKTKNREFGAELEAMTARMRELEAELDKIRTANVRLEEQVRRCKDGWRQIRQISGYALKEVQFV
jgi:predicted nuclease with TOPRIM domain